MQDYICPMLRPVIYTLCPDRWNRNMETAVTCFSRDADGILLAWFGKTANEYKFVVIPFTLMMLNTTIFKTAEIYFTYGDVEN